MLCIGDWIMKDTYYFPHDMNAQNDPRCVSLWEDFGASGYGIYWALIEILHQEGGRLEKFPKLFQGLAKRFKVTDEALLKQVQALLNEYNLLEENDTHIWSDRVLRNIEERKKKRDLKSSAGRIGGLKSSSSKKSKQTEAVLNGA